MMFPNGSGTNLDNETVEPMMAERWNVPPAAVAVPLSIKPDGSALRAAATRLMWMFLGAYTQIWETSEDFNDAGHLFSLHHINVSSSSVPSLRIKKILFGENENKNNLRLLLLLCIYSFSYRKLAWTDFHLCSSQTSRNHCGFLIRFINCRERYPDILWNYKFINVWGEKKVGFCSQEILAIRESVMFEWVELNSDERNKW